MLAILPARSRQIASQDKVPSRKRKSPETILDVERRSSPYERQLRPTDNMSLASEFSAFEEFMLSVGASDLPDVNKLDVYNGVMDEDENGFILCKPPDVPDVSTMGWKVVVFLLLQVHGKAFSLVLLNRFLTEEMYRTASRAETTTANILIRAEYVRRLRRVPGPPIKITNTIDASTPSLRFRYISENVLGDGVHQYSSATATGCQRCSPHMGRNIGCEYTKKCDCLEYAAVDESRLTQEQEKEYEHCKANGLSTLGFPKKFPYYAQGTKVRLAGTLVSFYLHSRRPIYECNDNCRCGPKCRNKNVQFGRKVEVEIFKTEYGRGWGLRCTSKLFEGQFIDTYRGEVITDEEATRREQTSSKAKASYLYSLDKFADSEELEHDPYVVDGEFMGGPVKFMNHSCQPNCRQYTVSYNKHDPYIYDIALFACRDIPAGEELTFDYLDKEEGEEEDVQAMEMPGKDAIPCLCRTSKCRRWLWT